MATTADAGPCVVSANGSVGVLLEVTNHAPMAGATVVQLYYQQKIAPVIRYYQQLVRYKKIQVGGAGSPRRQLQLRWI